MTAIVVISALIVAAVVAREAYRATHIQTARYIDCICNTTNGVLLTFDDGPDPEHTPQVLDALKQHNAKAIFFCIGQKAEMHPEIMQQIKADGHTIGQHTYHHNPFRSFCTAKAYQRELQQAHDALARQGIATTLFRPPLGITNAMISKAVEAMHYTTVAWSVRSFDTRNEPREKTLKRISEQLKPNSIILLHDRMPHAGMLTSEVIAEIERRGFRLATPDDINI